MTTVVEKMTVEGMLVNEAFYTAEKITADSYWGHDWSGSEPLAAFS